MKDFLQSPAVARVVFAWGIILGLSDFSGLTLLLTSVVAGMMIGHGSFFGWSNKP